VPAKGSQKKYNHAAGIPFPARGFTMPAKHQNSLTGLINIAKSLHEFSFKDGFVKSWMDLDRLPPR
jgi:hypothetical protein